MDCISSFHFSTAYKKMSLVITARVIKYQETNSDLYQVGKMYLNMVQIYQQSQYIQPNPRSCHYGNTSVVTKYV